MERKMYDNAPVPQILNSQLTFEDKAQQGEEASSCQKRRIDGHEKQVCEIVQRKNKKSQQKQSAGAPLHILMFSPVREGEKKNRSTM